MSKDMVWHELYDSIGDDECPVCRLVKKTVDQFIDAFLYENVNDPKLRKQLKESKGLCYSHAWLLQSYGDPLSHAIIYGDLLKEVVDIIDKNPLIVGKKQNFSLYEHLKPNSKCMICELTEQTQNTYLKVIDEFLCVDEVLRAKFNDSGLLCVPHLKELILLSKNEKSLKLIQDITSCKYKKTIYNLSEIQRKNDYRFSDEPWTDQERDAWSKAVRIMVGEKCCK